MNGIYPGRMLPAFGCLSMAITLLIACLMPYFLINAMLAALERLHLTPSLALLTLLAIIFGSMINIPVRRIEREREQLVDVAGVFVLGGLVPSLRRERRDTIIAVNLGGCMIPLALTAWELIHLMSGGGWPLVTALLVSAANVGVCYRVAMPVPGVGIAMPGFVSPLVTVGLSWL